MFRLLRILVAIFAVGFAGAYFLGNSLRLSSGPELLTYEEFIARGSAVSPTDEQLALLDSPFAAQAADPRQAYQQYLERWGQGDGTVLESAPSTALRLTDGFRRPWRRVYQWAARLVPVRRKGESAGPGGTPRGGIILVVLGLGAVLGAGEFLNSWLKNAARA